MHRNELIYYRKLKRVEGLYRVAGRFVVDRSSININLNKQGDKFRLWLSLGGRLGAVSVPAELRRLRTLEVSGGEVANP